jgi:lambda repressor-like predicted transcriptional regulator
VVLIYHPLFLYKEVAMDYKQIITRDDITTKLTKRGYNLNDNGILDAVHFTTLEDAVDDFLQGCTDSINDLITTYRGKAWTDKFLQDMSISGMTNPTTKQQEYHDEYIRALIEHIIFTYDNGDANASASKDNPNNAYSPKAVQILWNMNILR